jgi:hypothetical protein
MTDDEPLATQDPCPALRAAFSPAGRTRGVRRREKGHLSIVPVRLIFFCSINMP